MDISQARGAYEKLAYDVFANDRQRGLPRQREKRFECAIKEIIAETEGTENVPFASQATAPTCKT
jgi:hypothetical protein